MRRNLFSSLLVPVTAVLLVSLAATSAGLAQSITLSGGNIQLTFATPAAGSDLSDVVDNTSCSLSWSKPSGPPALKITVQGNIPPASANAALTVSAINTSGGSSTGIVELTVAAKPLVTGLVLTSGGCDLEYTASANLSDGTGNDVHTITFTITQ